MFKKTMQKKKRYFAFTVLLFTILISACIVRYHYGNSIPEAIEHRLQWWLSAINWDSERTGETGDGVVIAVLDSGVDTDHPDLEGKIMEEYRVSGLEKEDTGSLLHGTAVAGIIAGSPSDEKGVLGVAENASIISIDVTDNDNGTIEVENLIEGIEYAIRKSVDIINISAGVKNSTDELYEAVLKAYEAGIVIVSASGNYMEDDLLYPAKYDEVIAVGALAKDESYVSPTGEIDKNVIYLPGENIVTTSTDSSYTGIDGTSAATPILSGVIALMMEKNKTLTNEEIKKYFEGYTADMIDVLKCINLKY